MGSRRGDEDPVQERDVCQVEIVEKKARDHEVEATIDGVDFAEMVRVVLLEERKRSKRPIQR